MLNLKTRNTLLVIDDDEGIARTVKGNLELDGYHVIVTGDGKTGIDTIRGTRPDLVLLDLNLPDVDGLTVCKAIRREFDIPVIMLTARDSISDKVLGFECGADDYLGKPFNFLELSARIKALLKRSSSPGQKEPRVRTIKNLEINFKSRSLNLHGREINLTKKEFQLLELFIAYPDEVLSREFIHEQIWRDSQLYKHSRALDVHVQRLRKKIESDIENPEYILTVSGVGYKLVTG